jgi:hypothetical protein
VDLANRPCSPSSRAVGNEACSGVGFGKQRAVTPWEIKPAQALDLGNRGLWRLRNEACLGPGFGNQRAVTPLEMKPAQALDLGNRGLWRLRNEACLGLGFGQQAMQHIIEGCGDRFQPEVTPGLRDLLYRALLHPNRFVRETCYHIVASVCRVCAGPELEGFAADVADHLCDGLSENWSQVVLALLV